MTEPSAGATALGGPNMCELAGRCYHQAPHIAGRHLLDVIHPLVVNMSGDYVHYSEYKGEPSRDKGLANMGARLQINGKRCAELARKRKKKTIRGLTAGNCVASV